MSSFGRVFRVHTFGESHCKGVGCIIDGCPPGLPLDPECDIQPQLTRRRPGQSSITTPRNEEDKVEIFSGTEQGYTIGSPICLLVRNKDQRPVDYDNVQDTPRPSHADYSYLLKYGHKSSSGGGRSSARETIGRVAAGSVAEKYLKSVLGIEIVAFVSSVGEYKLECLNDMEKTHQLPELFSSVTRELVDEHPTRLPQKSLQNAVTDYIHTLKENHDSTGGTVTCVIRNCPPGLGEPSFDKLEACLAQAMLSIPATKGFEFGSGFSGSMMRGSEHNDMFISGKHRLETSTNRSGGIQGGISNGQMIYFSVSFKPPATISMPQKTSNTKGAETTLEAKGRHDPCVVPRAVPIVEAMSALCLMDALVMQMGRSAAVDKMIDYRRKYLAGFGDADITEVEKEMRYKKLHILTGGLTGEPDSWWKAKR